DHAGGHDPREPDVETGDPARDRVLAHGSWWDDPDGAAIRRRVAERERDVVDRGRAQQLGEEAESAGISGEPDAETAPGRSLPHSLDDLAKESATVAPLVVPQVEVGVDELLDQVAVGGRDLDAVDSAGRRDLGRSSVAVDDHLDLSRAHRPRLDPKSRARDGGRRKRRRARRGCYLL